MAPMTRMALCPQCSYSATPDEVFTGRKHFDAHAYRCVRCLYTTETKASWLEARRAWNKARAAATDREVAKTVKLYEQTAGPALSETEIAALCGGTKAAVRLRR